MNTAAIVMAASWSKWPNLVTIPSAASMLMEKVAPPVAAVRCRKRSYDDYRLAPDQRTTTLAVGHLGHCRSGESSRSCGDGQRDFDGRLLPRGGIRADQ